MEGLRRRVLVDRQVLARSFGLLRATEAVMSLGAFAIVLVNVVGAAGRRRDPGCSRWHPDGLRCHRGGSDGQRLARRSTTDSSGESG